MLNSLVGSVLDPYVFSPPGSGFVIICTGSGSFHQKAKKGRKTLIYAFFVVILSHRRKEQDPDPLIKVYGSKDPDPLIKVCGFKDPDPY
jgi:hypothetical protein